MKPICPLNNEWNQRPTDFPSQACFRGRRRLMMIGLTPSRYGLQTRRGGGQGKTNSNIRKVRNTGRCGSYVSLWISRSRDPFAVTMPLVRASKLSPKALPIYVRIISFYSQDYIWKDWILAMFSSSKKAKLKHWGLWREFYEKTSSN